MHEIVYKVFKNVLKNFVRMEKTQVRSSTMEYGCENAHRIAKKSKNRRTRTEERMQLNLKSQSRHRVEMT